MIDIFNDYIMYVVLYVRMLWYLLYLGVFRFVMKVVIMYVVKSKCKLVVYIWMSWEKG